MKPVFVLLLLTGLSQAQFLTSQRTQLECKESTWVGSTGPVNAHASDNCHMGIPIAEADGITGSLGGVPANLRLEDVNGNAVPAQFRITGIWPRTSNVKWVVIDTMVSLPAGTADYSVFLCKTSASCIGTIAGNSSGPNLATDNGATITVTTGSIATFIIQKANFDWFHSATISGQQIVSATGHGANDGLVLMGPATGLAMPGQASCLTGGNPDIAQCTTPWRSNQDASSTCSIEENGPVRAVVLCMGSFVNTGASYMHWSVREEFYAGKPYAKVAVILRNADNDLCVQNNNCGSAPNFNTSVKMYRSLEARLTMNLASGTRSVVFAATPSGSGSSTTFATATASLPTTSDFAYIYQAYSALEEWFDWRSLPACNGSNVDACIASPIARTNSTTYAQNGWTVQSSQALSGVTAGDNTTAAGGWADVQDINGAGVEIGVNQFSPYWPKSLEYRSGGSELRIGIWPDQAEWTAACTTGFADGTASPCHNAYALFWTHYSEQSLFFDFHSGVLPNESADFLKFQHPLVMRATPGGTTPANGGPPGAGAYLYYNAAKDSTSGLLALPVELPNPVDEDNYYKTVPGLSSNCSGTISGACITDLSAESVFRTYFWGQSGSGNQHDFALSDELLYLQRGLTGYYVFGKQFYQMVSEITSARSDFTGGWRSDCLADNCPDLQPGLGFPSFIPVNAQFAPRNYIEPGTGAGGGGHQHDFGYGIHYFISGDEDAKANLLSSYKDRFVNQHIALDNPFCTGCNQFISITRTMGHFLAGTAQFSEFLRTINDTDKDTLTIPTVLKAADQELANQTHNVFMSGTGESEPSGCTWVGGWYVGITCSHGINYKRGDVWYGTEADSFICDPSNTVGINCNEGANPPPFGTHVRMAKVFMMGILAFGMRQYELVAADVRGPGWSAGNGGVPAVTSSAGIPAGTLFGDVFVHSMEYALAESLLRENKVYASGVISTSGNTVTWIDGHTFPSSINGQSITINDQNYTVNSYTSITQIGVTPSPLGGPLLNVPYFWSGFDTTGSPNYTSSGLPYFASADFQNTTPPNCGANSNRTFCNGQASGGDGGKNCSLGQSGCQQAELQWIWAALGDMTGSTTDMGGNNWAALSAQPGSAVLPFEAWSGRANPSQGSIKDQSHYPMWGPVNYILHKAHDATTTQLKSVTLATGATCTLASSGTCTMTFTGVTDNVPHDGLNAIVKFVSDGTTIIDWIGFNDFNTTATYSQCVSNATPDPANGGSYTTGCWLNSPTANTNFWAASDVVTEPTAAQLAAGSYTTPSLPAGTYHFVLKYYGTGAAPTSFNLQAAVSPSGGGTVTSDVGGINTTSAQTVSFTSGTVVHLTATAAPSFTFSSWAGCDSVASNVCTVTMTSAKFPTANFSAIAHQSTGIIQ